MFLSWYRKNSDIIETKFEIRISKLETNMLLNPKFEYRNPKQIRNSNVQMTKTFGILNFCHLDLFRISDFVLRAFLCFIFRASDFNPPRAGQVSP